MNFRLWIPLRRTIPDALLVGLAERVNKRLGKPLQNAVEAADLLEQAELERIIEPRPNPGFLDTYHDRRYGRTDLVKLARRSRLRGKA